MIAQTTVKFGNFEENALKRLPNWTLPFLVSKGQKFMRNAGNNNLRLVQNESNISLETTNDNAFEQEFGSSDIEGDGQLQEAIMHFGGDE